MKYKIRGVVYLLIALPLLLLQFLTTLGLLLEVVDASPSYYPLIAGETLIWLAKIVIGIILIVKAVRLFRLGKDQPLVVSKKENVFLALLIICAWIAAPAYLFMGKHVTPVTNTKEANMSLDEKIKGISPVVASLPLDVISDLGVAYKALHSLYEKPRPASLEEYFVYTECAKHIVDEVALPKLTPAERAELGNMTVAEKYTTFKEENFAPQPPLFLALQSLVAQDVGMNNVNAYLTSGMVDSQTFYSPSVEACRGLDIPDKYKI